LQKLTRAPEHIAKALDKLKINFKIGLKLSRVYNLLLEQHGQEVAIKLSQELLSKAINEGYNLEALDRDIALVGGDKTQLLKDMGIRLPLPKKRLPGRPRQEFSWMTKDRIKVQTFIRPSQETPDQFGHWRGLKESYAELDIESDRGGFERKDLG